MTNSEMLRSDRWKLLLLRAVGLTLIASVVFGIIFLTITGSSGPTTSELAAQQATGEVPYEVASAAGKPISLLPVYLVYSGLLLYFWAPLLKWAIELLVAGDEE